MGTGHYAFFAHSNGSMLVDNISYEKKLLVINNRRVRRSKQLSTTAGKLPTFKKLVFAACVGWPVAGGRWPGAINLRRLAPQDGHVAPAPRRTPAFVAPGEE